MFHDQELNKLFESDSKRELVIFEERTYNRKIDIVTGRTNST